MQNTSETNAATCVNFTNILWAAFAPKSFWQKITNPNCKHIKVVQGALVCLSISPVFYEQLFHTKVLCAPFMCLQFGFVIFWRKDFSAKAAHKMLVKLTPAGSRNGSWYTPMSLWGWYSPTFLPTSYDHFKHVIQVIIFSS